MKKITILFCGLLVGLFVVSYLIATPKSSARELLQLNVEALSFNEYEEYGCTDLNGMCLVPNGYILGMAFQD